MILYDLDFHLLNISIWLKKYVNFRLFSTNVKFI